MEFTVSTKGRADIIIKEHLNCSRNHVSKLIKQNHIAVNGGRISPSKLLKEGDIVVINEAFKKAKNIREVVINIEKETGGNNAAKRKKKEISFKIVFENRDFAVIDKPPYIKVHPVNDNDMDKALTDELKNFFSSLSDLNGKIRPGIVHRLDKNTSGLLVIAKNNKTHERLAGLFKQRKIEKKYLALLCGNIKPTEGIIEAPIGRSIKDRKKMAIIGTGKMAVTKYKVLKQFKDFCLVAIDLLTGRTHQIRVHFRSMGFPVAGDEKYANRKLTKKWQKAGIKRLFLHCFFIKFKLKGKEFAFNSELPSDLSSALETLK